MEKTKFKTLEEVVLLCPFFKKNIFGMAVKFNIETQTISYFTFGRNHGPSFYQFYELYYLNNHEIFIKKIKGEQNA